MLENIVQEIAFQFLKRKIIEHEEIDIFMYGLEAILTSLITVISILIIGILLGKPWTTIAYLVIFILVRRYTGGFHSDTFLKCYFMSIGLYIVSIFVSNLIIDEYLLMINIISYIVSSAIILKVCPIEHKNNPLTKEEFKKNSKKIRGSLIIIGTFILLTLIINIPKELVNIVPISLVMIMITVLIEKYKGGYNNV